MNLALRIVVFIFCAAGCRVLARDAAADSAASRERYAKSVHPLLQRYCFGCHGPEKQKANIRYDHIDGYRAADQRLWAMVHEQLLTGEMPPEGKAQPTGAEKKAILAWVEQEATEARKAWGSGSTRRLNRRELSAALQDLTGLAVDYSDGLPDDGKVAGFDTGLEGLQDAADSVSQVMKVTRSAVDGLRSLEPAGGNVFEADLRQSLDPRKTVDAWKGKGAVVKEASAQRGKGLSIEPKWVGDRGGLTFILPTSAGGKGVLRLKLAVSAMKPLAEVPNPHLWVEVGGKDIDYREITGTFDAPQELVYEVLLDDLATDARGVAVVLSNKVEIPYAIEGFENEDSTKPEDKDKAPGGTGLFRPRFDRKALPPDKQPIPFLIVQRIEIDSDYRASWPPEHWQANLGPLGDSPESAGRLLRLWMERAFRRPVSAAEQERFLALYAKLREQKMSFDDAMRAAFQAVLLSSGFRYLASPADADPVIAQHAIASRLSFMLWGAPPDGELLRLAVACKLGEPAALDAQVDRLLSDPRSGAFFRPFVTQWLEMEQPITIAMDHIKKQNFRFGRYLKASMREETIRYAAALFSENRPARELIGSDWTMMNNILAIHYGYPAIASGQLRKVKLRENDPRGGGILGHAGLQSMLCWMGENWVIYRGAWAMRHILDDPPPPPPLEVPVLVPSEVANKGKTFKELLKQHQADMNCAICHSKMDPLGFAFQNFDLSGRWRDLEYDSYTKNELDGKIAWLGVGKSRPVDTAGRLPRGEEFNSFAECKKLIAEKYGQDIVRGLLKNLLMYAAGRQPDVFDMAEIRAIVKQHASKGYPLRDLLKAVLKFAWNVGPAAKASPPDSGAGPQARPKR